MSDELSDGEISGTASTDDQPVTVVRSVPLAPPLPMGPPLPVARIAASESPPEPTPQELVILDLRDFHATVTSTLQKARTEYALLFSRWKRQPLSETDEFDIPTWNAKDGNDILRWEFNFKTVQKTVWHPLFVIMTEQLVEAQGEIDDGMIAFAGITLRTVDELLERSLAHNRKLRAALVEVENPKPIPVKEFVPAEIDLSEWDKIGSISGTAPPKKTTAKGGGGENNRGGRGGSNTGGGGGSNRGGGGGGGAGGGRDGRRGDDRRDNRRDNRRDSRGGGGGGGARVGRDDRRGDSRRASMGATMRERRIDDPRLAGRDTWQPGVWDNRNNTRRASPRIGRVSVVRDNETPSRRRRDGGETPYF